MTTPIYLHDWADDGEKQMLTDFDVKPEALDGAKVLVASYTYEDYSGSAFVLFELDGRLFEVNGGHCSCYGLEGQWEPEEVSREALIHRLENGRLYDVDDVRDVLLATLRAAS